MVVKIFLAVLMSVLVMIKAKTLRSKLEITPVAVLILKVTAGTVTERLWAAPTPSLRLRVRFVNLTETLVWLRAAAQAAETEPLANSKLSWIKDGMTVNFDGSASGNVALALAVPVPAIRANSTPAPAVLKVVLVSFCPLSPIGSGPRSIGGNKPQPAKRVLVPSAKIDAKTIFFMELLSISSGHP
jgi:hypothetical protein